MTLLDTFQARLSRRSALRLDEAEVDGLMGAWRQAAEGAGLLHRVDTVSGPTITVPRIVHVVLGPPVVLTIRLLPGMLLSDVQAAGTRMAPHLGARRMRVVPIGLDYAAVTLLRDDPLDEPLPLDPAVTGPVLLGRAEDGTPITLDPPDLSHAVVQGVTRSGKSAWTYGMLAQLAHRPDVTVAGCDPTGLLFRPFTGTRHAKWQAAGLGDLDAHEHVLGRLVDEMDQRIALLPAHRDTLEVEPATPLVLVALEEYPGLLRAADADDGKRGKRIRAHVSRLLAEGAKAGVRVLILTQRAEAQIVGAFERAQCALRISFRCDNRASIEMLHPGADPGLADAHTTALPGVALISRPGHALTRMRGPLLGGDPAGVYPAYVNAIAACLPGSDA
jgi:DNA segregation ATPase FtsK/SpoIIIE-like protein